MIAALNNTTTSNGPGATTGQSARVREADVYDPSSDAQAEASAVVSLSSQAASLAASGSGAPAQAATGPASAVQTATAQAVTAAPATQGAAVQAADTPTAETRTAETLAARPQTAQPATVALPSTRPQTPVQPPVTTPAADVPAAAPAASTPTPAATVAAPAPAPTPAVVAQSTSFQASNALAAPVGQSTVEKFPPTVSLIPNLVFAEADRDENGVISPAERRAYDIVHPKLGERPADVPPKRVVDAELREYTSIANNQF